MWDVRTWEMVKLINFGGLLVRSLHLTSDSKYLTIGGKEGANCVVFTVVLEIK